MELQSNHCASFAKALKKTFFTIGGQVLPRKREWCTALVAPEPAMWCTHARKMRISRQKASGWRILFCADRISALKHRPQKRDSSACLPRPIFSPSFPRQRESQDIQQGLKIRDSCCRGNDEVYQGVKHVIPKKMAPHGRPCKCRKHFRSEDHSWTEAFRPPPQCGYCDPWPSCAWRYRPRTHSGHATA